MTPDDLLEEAIEDAIEAAVDYGFVQGRSQFSVEDVPGRTVEKYESLLEHSAENLYGACAVVSRSNTTLDRVKAMLERLKSKR